VLSDYAERLDALGGRLYVSGVDPALLDRIQRNRTVERVAGVRIFPAREVIGESSLEAYHAAEGWLTTLR
jgi:SulP family sulfate permease